MYGKRTIKLHKEDFEEKVGYLKGCQGEWTDCAEWDDNGECVREETFYEGCSELKVYLLTPCYDDYAEFKEAFFEDSGFSATDVEIFNGDYLTGEAQDVCWQKWNKIAEGRKLGWNVQIKDFGDSYNASGWTDVCVEEIEDCWEVEPGVMDCITDCIYETYIFYMYNMSWGEDDYGIPFPDYDCDEACLLNLFNGGLAHGNELLAKHYANPAAWTNTKTEAKTDLCFTKTITGGGSCYGGYGCHSFLWDGCAGVEFIILEPENLTFKKKPRGAKFLYNGSIITRNWR
jgi:hypothetical protein